MSCGDVPGIVHTDLTQRQRARNRRFGKVRAKVEHVFRVLKCQLEVSSIFRTLVLG